MIFFHPRACPLKALFSHILLTSSPQRVGMTIPSNYVLYTLQIYLLSRKAGKNKTGYHLKCNSNNGSKFKSIFTAVESIIASGDLASIPRANSLAHSLQEGVKTNTGQTQGQLQYNAVF